MSERGRGHGFYPTAAPRTEGLTNVDTLKAVLVCEHLELLGELLSTAGCPHELGKVQAPVPACVRSTSLSNRRRRTPEQWFAVPPTEKRVLTSSDEHVK